MVYASSAHENLDFLWLKLQWLQEQSEINEDDKNNIRSDTSRHFRNKKRQYLKDAAVP
jgi:hypothetical protein